MALHRPHGRYAPGIYARRALVWGASADVAVIGSRYADVTIGRTGAAILIDHPGHPSDVLVNGHRSTLQLHSQYGIRNVLFFIITRTYVLIQGAKKGAYSLFLFACCYAII